VRQLEVHGMTALGEQGDVSLTLSRQVFEASL
jgi:NADP-dependent alcohol dehydrogenase